MSVDTTPRNVARRLRAELAALGLELGHSRCLELVARAYGVRDWNTLAAAGASDDSDPADPAHRVPGAVPVLRVFGRDAAVAYYVDRLGFELVDEVGEAGLHEPVRLLVRRGDAVLQLSEHHDDASPGGAAVVVVDDVAALPEQLGTATPGVGEVGSAAAGPVLVVVDPFRNRLVFTENLSPAGGPAAAPIAVDLVVPVPPTEAFAVFTGRIGEWWPDGYAPGPLTDVRIEPGVGGAVLMALADGGTYVWGAVRTWEPGRHYAQSFTLAQDPDHPSRLDVRFVADRDGTRVAFRHGGWTAGNLDRRGGFTDWPKILDRYVDLVAGRAPRPLG